MGKKIIATAAVITGITIICGSIGACENGDYTLLQFIAGSSVGAALVCAGYGIRKERKEK